MTLSLRKYTIHCFFFYLLACPTCLPPRPDFSLRKLSLHPRLSLNSIPSNNDDIISFRPAHRSNKAAAVPLLFRPRPLLPLCRRPPSASQCQMRVQANGATAIPRLRPCSSPTSLLGRTSFPQRHLLPFRAPRRLATTTAATTANIKADVHLHSSFPFLGKIPATNVGRTTS